MTQNDTVPELRHMQSHRSGPSRKLLSRKAGGVATAAQGEALEDVFPDHDASATPRTTGLQADSGAPDAEANVAVGTVEAMPFASDLAVGDPVKSSVPDKAKASAAGATWSNADEITFQAMLTRRKNAGYQRRGRDVTGQRLRVGDISPNPGTVVATIVALVAERRTVTRGELLDAMAVATFANAKAKGADRNWSMGWISGALRDGFLTLAASSTEAYEISSQVSL